MRPPRIAIATNNGDIGGGEVMLQNIAVALRSMAIEPVVIAPTEPSGVLTAAMSRDFETIVLPATGRRQYMMALAAWRRRNITVPLWCNGLVPSMATAGLGPRIVHLHIVPEGNRRVAAALARKGARSVLVPSQYMGQEIPGTRVLSNWTEGIDFRPREFPGAGPIRIGFLGRFTRDKGLDVLAHAVEILRRSTSREIRLVLGGENRFGTSADDVAIAAALEPIGDRVDKLGWVERSMFFSSVDIAVFPSVLPEPFGLVAAEAMAAGVPVVVSDAGGLPEVVGVGHPWVARRGEAGDLARVIGVALSAPDAQRRGVVEGARRRWENLYSPQAGAQRVAELLQDLAPGIVSRDDRLNGRGTNV